MDIAILGGTGALGRGLALRLAIAGHRVLVGSRNHERAEEAAEKLRAVLKASGVDFSGSVKGTTNHGAASSGELVVLATPSQPDADFFAAISEALCGKVLLDCTVHLHPNDPTQVAPGEPATAERISQELGPDVIVVAGFHTLAAAKLEDLSQSFEADTFVVGDSDEGKALVKAMANSIGVRCFDAGQLSNGRTLERMTALLIGLNKRYRRRGLGFSLSGM